MTKKIAVLILPLVLLGCEEQHSFEYYLENEGIRKTTISACPAIQDVKLETLNCINAAHADKTAAIDVLREVAKIRVLLTLEDPESARFYNLSHQEGTNIICGYVSAKDSHGAYIHNRPFFVIDGIAYVTKADDSEGIGDSVLEICNDKQG